MTSAIFLEGLFFLEHCVAHYSAVLHAAVDPSFLRSKSFPPKTVFGEEIKQSTLVNAVSCARQLPGDTTVAYSLTPDG